MSDAPVTRYATTHDGLRIAYQVFGDGPRDVVFIPALHCIDMIWEEPSFAHLLERLASFGRLICFDFRGWGASDGVPLGALPTVEAWMEDIRAVLDEVGSKHADVIVEVASTLLALTFAATYPERTTSLTVMNGTCRLLQSDDYPLGFPEETVKAFVAALSGSWGAGRAAVRSMAPSRAEDATFVRWHNRFERCSMSPTTWSTVMHWTMRLDLRALLPAVRVPTLILHRQDYFAVPAQHGRYLAANIPNARFKLVPGTDQYIFTQNADDIVDEIEEFITGTRPIIDANRVLATVLFTDIVNSTPQSAEVGDGRWKTLLDRHDDAVARELDRHRGRRIKSTGDGILATFDGPARAVRCARSIMDAVAPLGLSLRAGLHTGEIELRGDDVSGLAVVIGQRVSALARANETLVSSTVKDLVAGSGILFADRGEHSLKGVPGDWRLFAVEG